MRLSLPFARSTVLLSESNPNPLPVSSQMTPKPFILDLLLRTHLLPINGVDPGVAKPGVLRSVSTTGSLEPARAQPTVSRIRILVF